MCNLPPALVAEWPGSFTCHCGIRGVEQTLNKNQHTKLNQEKRMLPPLLPEFELTTFWSRVRCSYQQAILALPCPRTTSNTGEAKYSVFHNCGHFLFSCLKQYTGLVGFWNDTDFGIFQKLVFMLLPFLLLLLLLLQMISQETFVWSFQ